MRAGSVLCRGRFGDVGGMGRVMVRIWDGVALSGCRGRSYGCSV